METFDIKESWIVKLNTRFEEQKEKMNEKDLKFFNINIILDQARLTQKHSYQCKECVKNKDVLTTLVDEIDKNIDTIEGRKEITKKLDKISTHLRKEHKLYIRRYISSLYSLFGILGGLAISLAVYYFSSDYKYILWGTTIGLIIGSLLGSIKEKNLIKKGNIYGKF